VHAIVLAGGSGRRVAALTERVTGRPTPKQYCAFGRQRTLIQETVARLAPLVPPFRTVAVVQESHEAIARKQLALFRGITLLAQPSDRGTGPGVLRALVHILGRDPDALVVVTPSDHGVGSREAYLRGVSAARDAAWRASAVLLGVESGEACTDYGWIVPGPEIAPQVHRVVAFVEKPGPAEAAALHARGALYSTMVLVARGRALLDLFERARPGLAAVFGPLGSLPTPARAIHLQRAYALLSPCDFSRDILAPAPDLAVLRWPREVGWTDLGTPERVAEWLSHEPALLT